MAARADARPGLALLLLVPAPTLGVLCGGVWFRGTTLGGALFLASKIWTFGLPVIWTRFVAREPMSLSPARRGGFGVGALSGLGIAAAILGAWFLLGPSFGDPDALGERIRSTGIGTPPRFLLGSIYWITVNSVLEEYAWRWFCLEQWRAFLPDRVATPLSALCFTLHHVVILLTLTTPGAALACSAGVFAGGLLWSWMYARYGSIWPGYLSHAIVDAAIFGIGAAVAFG